jgi:hypothetical protein
VSENSTAESKACPGWIRGFLSADDSYCRRVTKSRTLRASVDLFPGYCALVMATGIISIACFFLEMKTLAIVLLAVNIVAFAQLSVVASYPSLLHLSRALGLVIFFLLDSYTRCLLESGTLSPNLATEDADCSKL